MRKLIILSFLVMLLPFGTIVAQDNDRCDVDSIHASVEAVWRQYELRQGTDIDTASALASVIELQTRLNGIVAGCEEEEPAEEGEPDAETAALLNDLQQGGYVLYVRHTHTDRSRGDTDLSSCETQRILSEQGRDEARMINDYWEELDIPVSRLISTEYCRTQQTAELAFGQPEIINRTELFEQLPSLLASEPESGTNWLIVAHIGTLEGATGLTVGVDVPFNEGDTRIALEDWELLAAAAEAE